eukprot:c12717_g1_i1.p1 GENE.c12717_g1_i1~~c12717_g1_i1.p1  ORF type:complete len:755 (-),score=187.40 c12717_g1_i1:1084-3276(-)
MNLAQSQLRRLSAFYSFYHTANTVESELGQVVGAAEMGIDELTQLLVRVVKTVMQCDEDLIDLHTIEVLASVMRRGMGMGRKAQRPNTNSTLRRQSMGVDKDELKEVEGHVLAAVVRLPYPLSDSKEPLTDNEKYRISVILGRISSAEGFEPPTFESADLDASDQQLKHTDFGKRATPDQHDSMVQHVHSQRDMDDPDGDKKKQHQRRLNEIEQSALQPCPHCGRKFFSDRLPKHIAASHGGTVSSSSMTAAASSLLLASSTPGPPSSLSSSLLSPTPSDITADTPADFPTKKRSKSHKQQASTLLVCPKCHRPFFQDRFSKHVASCAVGNTPSPSSQLQGLDEVPPPPPPEVAKDPANDFKKEYEEIANQLVKCPHCPRKFLPDRLEKHMKVEHADLLPQKLPEPPAAYKMDLVDHSDEFAETMSSLVECHLCLRKFLPDRMEKHLKVCQGKPEQVRRRTSNTELNRHDRRNSSNEGMQEPAIPEMPRHDLAHGGSSSGFSPPPPQRHAVSHNHTDSNPDASPVPRRRAGSQSQHDSDKSLQHIADDADKLPPSKGEAARIMKAEAKLYGLGLSSETLDKPSHHDDAAELPMESKPRRSSRTTDSPLTADEHPRSMKDVDTHKHSSHEHHQHQHQHHQHQTTHRLHTHLLARTTFQTLSCLLACPAVAKQHLPNNLLPATHQAGYTSPKTNLEAAPWSRMQLALLRKIARESALSWTDATTHKLTAGTC